MSTKDLQQKYCDCMHVTNFPRNDIAYYMTTLGLTCGYRQRVARTMGYNGGQYKSIGPRYCCIMFHI